MPTCLGARGKESNHSSTGRGCKSFINIEPHFPKTYFFNHSSATLCVLCRSFCNFSILNCSTTDRTVGEFRSVRSLRLLIISSALRSACSCVNSLKVPNFREVLLPSRTGKNIQVPRASFRTAFGFRARFKRHAFLWLRLAIPRLSRAATATRHRGLVCESATLVAWCH